MDVIEEIRPTEMCAVPRLYEKAYAAIQARVAKAPPLRRALFAWATRVGTRVVEHCQAGASLSPLLRIGDAGSVDAGGRVYFHERIKELMKTAY